MSEVGSNPDPSAKPESQSHPDKVEEEKGETGAEPLPAPEPVATEPPASEAAEPVPLQPENGSNFETENSGEAAASN